MSVFASKLAPFMDTMLDYREALGHSRKSYVGILSQMDRFLAANYPDSETLTQEAALEWINRQDSDLGAKATVLRTFGSYLSAIGMDAYILPQNLFKRNVYCPAAYLFSDKELRRLFNAADKFPARREQPFLPEIIPVMFRLTYTCGLRPSESRELKHVNVNFKTGEILIANTKHKKDRMVVMSSDMLKLARRYDEKRAVFSRGSEYFFPSWNGDMFSNKQISDYFSQCWKLANPDTASLPRVRVYDLRHRFASAVMIRWLDSGQPLMAKLPYLRAYMGHEDLSDTLYYVHLLPENLVSSSGIDWAAFDGIVPEVAL
jgi:site-specific recombinase XerD